MQQPQRIESRVAQPLVSFRVGKQLFALKVAEVRNALRTLAMTAVPKAPKGIAGIGAHAGKPVTAIDLRTVFNMPSHAADATQAVLLVTHDGEEIALLVDKIEDIIEATDADFSAVPVTMGPEWQRVTASVVQHPGGLLAMLNVNGVLSSIAA